MAYDPKQAVILYGHNGLARGPVFIVPSDEMGDVQNVERLHP